MAARLIRFRRRRSGNEVIMAGLSSKPKAIVAMDLPDARIYAAPGAEKPMSHRASPTPQEKVTYGPQAN